MRRTHGSEGAPVRQRTGATRLGDDDLGSGPVNPRDLPQQPGGRLVIGGDPLSDLGVEFSEGGIKEVQVGQDAGSGDGVMGTEVAIQSSGQLGDLRP